MPLNREEAVALLKELVSLNFLQPSFISMKRSEQDQYSLILRVGTDVENLRAFLADKKT